MEMLVSRVVAAHCQTTIILGTDTLIIVNVIVSGVYRGQWTQLASNLAQGGGFAPANMWVVCK